MKILTIQVHITLGPAYNEYGYYEQISLHQLPSIDCNAKKFGYYKQICLLSHLQ